MLTEQEIEQYWFEYEADTRKAVEQWADEDLFACPDTIFYYDEDTGEIYQCVGPFNMDNDIMGLSPELWEAIDAGQTEDYRYQIAESVIEHYLDNINAFIRFTEFGDNSYCIERVMTQTVLEYGHRLYFSDLKGDLCDCEDTTELSDSDAREWFYKTLKDFKRQGSKRIQLQLVSRQFCTVHLEDGIDALESRLDEEEEDIIVYDSEMDDNDPWLVYYP